MLEPRIALKCGTWPLRGGKAPQGIGGHSARKPPQTSHVAGRLNDVQAYERSPRSACCPSAPNYDHDNTATPMSPAVVAQAPMAVEIPPAKYPNANARGNALADTAPTRPANRRQEPS